MKKNIDKEKEKNMKKLTQDEYIRRCSLRHNNKFNYSKVKFKNVREKVIIICPTHGDIHIDAGNHLYRNGCDSCARDKHKLTNLSEERLENLKMIHNNKYTYSDLKVDKGFINIECPEHGTFRQYLYFHEYGHGCTECNSSSRGEDKIKSILDNLNLEYYRNHIFNECKNKKGLRFDFYLPNLNSCIEYDGEHHFKENKYFGIGNLEYVRKNDDIKNKYCRENNIKLIRIPYYDYDKIDEILSILRT